MKGLLIKVHLFFGYSYSLIPKELRSQVAKGEGTGNIVARVPQNQHFQPFCDPIFKFWSPYCALCPSSDCVAASYF